MHISYLFICGLLVCYCIAYQQSLLCDIFPHGEMESGPKYRKISTQMGGMGEGGELGLPAFMISSRRYCIYLSTKCTLRYICHERHLFYISTRARWQGKAVIHHKSTVYLNKRGRWDLLWVISQPPRKSYRLASCLIFRWYLDREFIKVRACI